MLGLVGRGAGEPVSFDDIRLKSDLLPFTGAEDGCASSRGLFGVRVSVDGPLIRSIKDR